MRNGTNGTNGRYGPAQMAGAVLVGVVALALPFILGVVPLDKLGRIVPVDKLRRIVPVYKLGRIVPGDKSSRIGEEEIQLDDSIVGYSPKDFGSEERLRDRFQSWMQKHDKSYKSESETNHRFAIFKDNLRYIHSHNVQHPTPSYSLGLNNFADLTNEEYKTRYLGYKPPPPGEIKLRKTENFIYGDVVPPARINWTRKGAVTAIKDQGQCGESSSSEL
jgi:hypothetical protein